MAGKKYWKMSRVVKVITSENIECFTSGQNESKFFSNQTLVAAVESRLFCHSRLKDMNQI